MRALIAVLACLSFSAPAFAEDGKVDIMNPYQPERKEFLKNSLSDAEHYQNRWYDHVKERYGDNTSVVRPVKDIGDGRLSEGDIKAFYAESITMYTKSLEENGSFMKKHLHEDIQVVLNATYYLPNLPQPRHQSFSLGKEALLRTSKEAKDRLKDVGHFPIKSEITDLKIAEDGKSATLTENVSYSVKIDARLVPGLNPTGGIMNMTFDSSCDDTVILGAQNVIKISRSNCNVTYRYQP